VPAHQRQQPTVLAGDGIDLAPAVQEVMIDDADDMEAVGDGAGVLQVLAKPSAR